MISQPELEATERSDLHTISQLGRALAYCHGHDNALGHDSLLRHLRRWKLKLSALSCQWLALPGWIAFTLGTTNHLDLFFACINHE